MYNMIVFLAVVSLRLNVQYSDCLTRIHPTIIIMAYIIKYFNTKKRFYECFYKIIAKKDLELSKSLNAHRLKVQLPLIFSFS